MSEQVAIPNLPAVIATRYVPIRLIGRGGMGRVYEVEHARTGERLALKVLLSTVDPSADALERFKREARASARIKSEHVVRVTDADVAPELDGAPFLVMELLEGLDLEQAATALRPTPATVVDWLRQVARAVDKAHRIGIVHRDLKPENLFLANIEDHAPMVKVLDFGIAKMAQEGTGATGSGQVLGTPTYMAPEQASGSAQVTPATDLYALGLIAYRLILGNNYYHPDDNMMSILGTLLHGQLRPPSARNPSFGPAFDDWFRRACHREPQRRFPTAAAQVEALAEAFGLPTVSSGAPHDRASPDESFRIDAAPTVGLQPGRRVTWDPVPADAASKSRRGVLVLAAAVSVAVVIAGVLVLRNSTASRSEGRAGPETTPAATSIPGPPPVVGPTGAPAVAVPAAPDELPPRAPSTATPATIPAASGAPRVAAKKARAASRVPGIEGSTQPPASPDADPFRDQK